MVNISHSQATRDKVRATYEETHSAEETSRRTGISQTNVRRWCRDLIANSSHKKASKHDAMMEHVKRMRKECHETKCVDIARYVRETGMNEDRVRRAVNGISFKSLNESHPPFKIQVKKDFEQQKARELYAGGKTYKQILVILQDEYGKKVSKTSLSLWLSDISSAAKNKAATDKSIANDPELREKIRSTYLELGSIQDVVARFDIGRHVILKMCKDLIPTVQEKRKTYIKPRKPRTSASNAAVLKDEQVIFLRQEVRKSGKKNWRYWASFYSVSAATISVAARGLTFAHLNKEYPPVTDNDVHQTRESSDTSRFVLDPVLVDTMVENIRQDPKSWGYSQLAAWLSEKVGRIYRPGQVASLLMRKDPDLKKLVDEHAVKNKPTARPVVKRPMTAEDIRAKAIKLQQKREERAAFRKFMRECDEYERAMSSAS